MTAGGAVADAEHTCETSFEDMRSQASANRKLE